MAFSEQNAQVLRHGSSSRRRFSLAYRWDLLNSMGFRFSHLTSLILYFSSAKWEDNQVPSKAGMRKEIHISSN